ncbi:toxin [Rhodococcus daqingensis]|uniref:Toxin n=1 Tax=Rhodococcus daqingensis TaxID=2479363 RepID=A0ABW2RYL7_9NOCA
MAKEAQFHLYSTRVALAKDAVWARFNRPNRQVRYRFQAHYHPFTDELIERLNVHGLDALLDAEWQENLARELTPQTYTLDEYTLTPFPAEAIDVSDTGPYSIYNWELFFHAPVLIATHLSKNQRFAEAQHWFHCVFDPTTEDDSIPAPQRFWKFLRFRNETTPDLIGELLTKLAEGKDSDLKTRMETAIRAWRDNPFQPHVIARGRALAYQLNVLMKYLDNLILWGDSLFRQHTIESMNEATQIYVLAASLLGRKPQPNPPRGEPPRLSYAQLKARGIDAFGNALVAMENAFPADSSGVPSAGTAESNAAFGIGRSLYFCIPPNDMLLSYWDRVADRLFKLRHCMDIEGVVRLPALFEPEIDPGVMVRAAAAGLDIAGVVNNVTQPVSVQRGPLLLLKAQELCNEVKALGAALLSAVEKGEAEQLAALRQSHELRTLRLARDVRFLQWKDAESATHALLASRATVWERYRHYKRILGVEAATIDAVKTVNLARQELTEDTFDTAYAELVTAHTKALGREDYRKETSVGGLMEFAGNAVVSVVGGELGKTLPLNKNENAELNIFLPTADAFALVSTVMGIAAPVLSLIPQFGAAAKPMGVGAEVGFGGIQLSKAASYSSRIAEQVATAYRSSAERAAKMAGYYRRAEDYVLQANLAASELEQYGRQIVSSLLREQVLKREYENHQRQIENAEAVDAFMHEKFTNAELYGWMQGQLAQAHYEAYKFAFDVAKRAEQTLAYELMRPEFDEARIIQFGYWDAGRKGLLAGERLSLDLRRLELAYLEHNRREYELTKHVSLARLDPRALLRLRATGVCEFTVPEWVFDLDSPGQYLRRIKTAALSIPAVTGPFTTIHAKLSLLRSSIRTSPLLGDQYARATDGEDNRFRDYAGAIQSVVTSSAQNDSGLFELNLRDERRLPFEGAGAISVWRLEVPGDIAQFDLESISDIVLHLRYTAREAGNLRTPAVAYITEEVLAGPEALARLFSLPYDFAEPWRAFSVADNDADRALSVSVTQDHFPYWVRRLGMEDQIVATFAVTDRAKRKLVLAPAAVPLTGDAAEGWNLTIDNTSPVFLFLKKHRTEKVNMTVSYTA